MKTENFPTVNSAAEINDSHHYWIRFQYDYLEAIKLYGKWRIMDGEQIKRVLPHTFGFECEGPILRH